MVRKKFAPKAASALMAAVLAVTSVPYVPALAEEPAAEEAAVQAEDGWEADTEAHGDVEDAPESEMTEAPGTETETEPETLPGTEAPESPSAEDGAQDPETEMPEPPAQETDAGKETEVPLDGKEEGLEGTTPLEAGGEDEEETISVEYANLSTGEEWSMDCALDDTLYSTMKQVCRDLSIATLDSTMVFRWSENGSFSPCAPQMGVGDAYSYAAGKDALSLSISSADLSEDVAGFSVSASEADGMKVLRLEADVASAPDDVLYVSGAAMSAMVSSPYTLEDTILAMLAAAGKVDPADEDATAEGVYLDVLDEKSQARICLNDKDNFSGMDLYALAGKAGAPVFILHDGTAETARLSLTAGMLSANGLEAKKLEIREKSLPQAHTITYHLNGGTSAGGHASAVRGHGEAVGYFDMEEPSGGSGFTGWYTAATGGRRVFTTDVVNADMDLYAHYAGGTDVVFDWGFPASFEEENHRETACFEMEGGKYTLFDVPLPIRNGYHFLGWEGQDGKALHPAGKGNTDPRVFYAKWSSSPLPVVTYHVNDGTGRTFRVSQSAAGFYATQSDGTREEIDPSELSGDVFLGWYTGPDAPVYEYTDYSCACGEVFRGAEAYQQHADESCMDGRSHSYSMREVFSGASLVSTGEPIADDTDLYAHWEEGVVVSFDDGLPQYDFPSIIVLKGKSLRKSMGTSVALDYVMPEPAWEGHTFVAWCKPDGTEVDIDTVFDTDTVLTAKWDTLTYTVTFDAGEGGTVEGWAAVLIPRGERLTALPKAEKEHHTFDGWFTEAEGGSPVTVPKVITGDVTFYAHWTENTYTVVFDAGEGFISSGITVATAKPGECVPQLPLVTCNGKKFLGWFVDREGTTPFTVSTPVSRSMTVYALYEDLNLFKDAVVTFDANGGTASEAQRSVPKETAVGPLPAVTRDGYQFAGWYTQQSSGVRVTEDTIVDADVTYYAHWIRVTKPLTSLQLTPDTLDVSFGDPLNLSYTYAPEDADNADFYWTSSNPEVIRVVGMDSFQYVAGGVTTLTIHSVDNALQASCVVTVTKPRVVITELAFDNPYQEVEIGDGILLSISYGPKGAENSQFVWSSSNTDIIRIAEDGMAWVYGGDTGTVTLTVSTKDGSMQAACTIKVNPKKEIPKDDPDDPATPVVIKYTISYDTDGGNVLAPSTVISGDTLSPLPVPVKAGYDFRGWFLASGLQVESVTPGYDLTLYAHWRKTYVPMPEQYEVLLLPMNGEGPAVKNYIEGDTFGELPQLSRKGYRFLGWFTSPAGGQKVLANEEVAVSRTIYAHWKKDPERFTLTLDPNGGQGMAGADPLALELILEELAGNGNDVAAYAPSRQGHTFSGWFDRPEGGTMVYAPSGACVGGTSYWQDQYTYTGGKDLYLYAQWTKDVKQYALTFDARGGEGINPVFYPDGTEVRSFPVTQREGYTFLGWFTAPTAGDKVTSIIMEKARTIYAQWKKAEGPEEEKTCTITFDACGGTPVGTASAKEGDQVSLPVTAKDGYDFLGWFTAKVGGIKLSSITAERDMTVYAHWEEILPPAAYLVTFDFQDGRTKQSEVMSGVEFTGFPDARREGYTFLGWFTAKEGGEKAESFVADRDMVFYAHWEKIPKEEKKEYTITFDPCGGSPVPSISAEEGTRTDVFPLPKREGCTFLGWYTAPENGRRVSAVLLKADVTLYAAWEKDKTAEYTLTFDFRDGKAGEEVKAEAGREFTEFPSRSRAGYKLLGWSLEKGGDSLVTSVTPSGSMTLYAVWEEVKEEPVYYTLTFDANGGEPVPSRKAEKGTKITVFPEAVREGYIFTGWYTRAEGGFKAASVTVRSDITVYAHWEARTKPVTLLELNYHELKIKYGTSPLGLSFKYGPSGASNAEFTWSSSDPSVIAIVEAEGADGKTVQTFRYKGTGRTVLTISTKDGTISDSCAVEVTPASISGSGSGSGAGSSGSWNGAGSGTSGPSGDTEGVSTSGEDEVPLDTVTRLTLALTTETGARKNVAANSNVTLSALAEKLGYDVSYFTVWKGGTVRKLGAGATIGEALSGTAGTIELTAYLEDGTAAGTVTATKSGADAYTVKITSAGQEDDEEGSSGDSGEDDSRWPEEEEDGVDTGSRTNRAAGSAPEAATTSGGSSQGKGDASDAATGKVQTSDVDTILVYGAIAAAMAGTIAILAVLKRKKKKK